MFRNRGECHRSLSPPPASSTHPTLSYLYLHSQVLIVGGALGAPAPDGPSGHQHHHDHHHVTDARTGVDNYDAPTRAVVEVDDYSAPARAVVDVVDVRTGVDDYSADH